MRQRRCDVHKSPPHARRGLGCTRLRRDRDGRLSANHVHFRQPHTKGGVGLGWSSTSFWTDEGPGLIAVRVGGNCESYTACLGLSEGRRSERDAGFLVLGDSHRELTVPWKAAQCSWNRKRYEVRRQSSACEGLTFARQSYAAGELKKRNSTKTTKISIFGCIGPALVLSHLRDSSTERVTTHHADRNTSTRNFSHALCTSDCVHTHCLAQDDPRIKSVSVCVSFHPHVIHDVMCLSVLLVSSCLSLSCFLSGFYLFSSTLCLFSVRHTISMSIQPRVKNHCTHAE